MPQRTSATRVAARARLLCDFQPGTHRNEEIDNLTQRIYAEAHRIYMGDLEVISVFDDGSILHMNTQHIKSLRLLERRKILAHLADEPGHTPRAPSHSLPYQRLHKSCTNILDHFLLQSMSENESD